MVRALVLEAPRRLVVRQYRLPRIGDDDALVRVEACGLCGTDHEQYTGELGRWVCLRTWPRDGRDDCGHRSAGGAAVGRVGRRPSSRRGIPVVSAVR